MILIKMLLGRKLSIYSQYNKWATTTISENKNFGENKFKNSPLSLEPCTLAATSTSNHLTCLDMTLTACPVGQLGWGPSIGFVTVSGHDSNRVWDLT